MLVVHHLRISQSERVVWLLEELGLEYKLVTYDRDPLGAPAALKNLPGNASGTSPFIEDTAAGITLGESGAVCEYILARYGGGRCALPPTDPHFSEYLFWFHFANATLQPGVTTTLFVADLPADALPRVFVEARFDLNLKLLDDRLASNKWLAGPEFTAADIMSGYTLTTGRWYAGFSLAKYPNILRWLKDVSARPAYQAAMEKSDPELRLLLDAEPPEVGLFQAGGIPSGVWKKK